MNTSVIKIGFWSSVISIASFVIYTFCFIAILFVHPLFIWSNYQNYIKTVLTTNQAFKYAAMFFMIVYGACFVIQLCSIEEIVEPARKYYAKVAKLFGTGFFVLIGINYFLQISAVRLQISAGQTQGLEQWIQENPISGVAAINMLGWTIFFGLACIFISLAFGDRKPEKLIKYAFLANGIIMLLGGAGYLLQSFIITFFCMYIGMGAAVLTATIPLCRWFKSFYPKELIA